MSGFFAIIRPTTATTESGTSGTFSWMGGRVACMWALRMSVTVLPWKGVVPVSM